MSSFLVMFGITAFVMLTVVALMGVKVILKPGSEFKKNCGSMDRDSGCSHCGRPSDEVCDAHDSGGCDDHRDGNNESRADT